VLMVLLDLYQILPPAAANLESCHFSELWLNFQPDLLYLVDASAAAVCSANNG